MRTRHDEAKHAEAMDDEATYEEAIHDEAKQRSPAATMARGKVPKEPSKVTAERIRRSTVFPMQTA